MDIQDIISTREPVVTCGDHLGHHQEWTAMAEGKWKEQELNIVDRTEMKSGLSLTAFEGKHGLQSWLVAYHCGGQGQDHQDSRLGQCVQTTADYSHTVSRKSS